MRMQMLNTKSLALAVGLASVVMAIISLIILGTGGLALAGIPEISGVTAFFGTIISLAVIFLQGVILGSLIGWLYNAFSGEPERNRREERDIFATP